MTFGVRIGKRLPGILAACFWLAGAIALLLILPKRISRTSRSRCRNCNVVVIMIDTLRPDRLPCYGYDRRTAPKLCAYADTHIRFSDAFANSSWTLPSDMSLFTSLYPSSHSMGVTLKNALNPAVPTLPELFRRQGYETIFVSNDQANVSAEQGFGRGFNDIRYTGTDSTTQETQDAWIRAIDDIRTANRLRKPAFVFFHTDAVHDYIQQTAAPPDKFPLDPAYRPQAYQNRTAFTQEVRDAALERITFELHTHPSDTERTAYEALYRKLSDAPNLTEAEKYFRKLPEIIQRNSWTQALKTVETERNSPSYFGLASHLYDEAIRQYDSRLSQVLERIRNDGLDRNTIVVISSEHGELLGEHEAVGHAVALYKQEISIPLIMGIPGYGPAVRSGLVQLMDLFPTLLDLTGIPKPDTLAGTSLLRFLYDNRSPSPDTFVVSEGTMTLDDRSIVTDRWHLIEKTGGNKTYHELYDRLRDPTETHSVAAEHSEEVERLSKLMHTRLDAQEYYPPVSVPFPDWIDERHRKNLIRTGYF